MRKFATPRIVSNFEEEEQEDYSDSDGEEEEDPVVKQKARIRAQRLRRVERFFREQLGWNLENDDHQRTSAKAFMSIGPIHIMFVWYSQGRFPLTRMGFQKFLAQDQDKIDLTAGSIGLQPLCASPRVRR